MKNPSYEEVEHILDRHEESGKSRIVLGEISTGLSDVKLLRYITKKGSGGVIECSEKDYSDMILYGSNIFKSDAWFVEDKGGYSFAIVNKVGKLVPVPFMQKAGLLRYVFATGSIGSKLIVRATEDYNPLYFFIHNEDGRWKTRKKYAEKLGARIFTNPRSIGFPSIKQVLFPFFKDKQDVGYNGYFCNCFQGSFQNFLDDKVIEF